MAEQLAAHTTLRLGGPAQRWITAHTEADLIDAVSAADATSEPVLLVGGGSNLVVADAGFPGLVVQIATQGVALDVDDEDTLASCSGVTATVAAGENWDELVATSVARNWVGIEALSGIPGLVGATPFQNVGAYGQEVADVIASVRTWDRHERAQRTFAVGDCEFGYRSSRFKAEPDRYLILEVTFQFKQGTLGAPVRYAELAHALDLEIGERAELAAVRREVLRLRANKGMVLDAADHDTWSAGSFFTNPILTPSQASALPEEAPRFTQPDGSVKTSAAWLIDHAGFAKGYALGGSASARVGLSTKHTLALTNRGGATTAELLELAREIRAGVAAHYGVELEPEPRLVGCSL